MAYLWMLCGSIFFAFMALLAESVKEQFSFPWIAMVRSGIATILAFGLVIAAGAKLVFWKPSSLWIRSLSGWVSMIFGFYAMTHYDVEIVLALSNSYPIWVAILSWPILGIVPSRKSWIALAISCTGMWLVYASSIAAGPQSQAFYSPQTAIPSAVIASILSGVALLNLHRLKDLDTRAVVTHFSAVATTCSFFVWISIPLTDTYSVVDWYGIVRLIGVGVAATFGQLCLTKAFTTGSPANVSIVGLSQVAVAALVKWAVEQQSPSVGSLIGMGMVIASTIWVMLRQPESTA